MTANPRVLLVDDEDSIRLTLGMCLQDQEFQVTSVGTVPEALKLITQQSFDVLIADLNVGYAGDGFTVVSAMRRTQPGAVTFILTGYPAFETALQAIRLQVDDYLTKPTDAESLAGRIRSKLLEPKSGQPAELKRATQIISDHLPEITKEWLQESRDDLELGAIHITDEERTDHIPRVIRATLKICSGEGLTPEDRSAARDHGVVRRKQGFTPSLMIRETRFLQTVISRCIQTNLLSVQISNLISDQISVQQTLQILLEESVSAMLKDKK
jgi:YesN/AraC family two-component response regulator